MQLLEGDDRVEGVGAVVAVDRGERVVELAQAALEPEHARAA